MNKIIFYRSSYRPCFIWLKGDTRPLAMLSILFLYDVVVFHRIETIKVMGHSFNPHMFSREMVVSGLVGYCVIAVLLLIHASD